MVRTIVVEGNIGSGKTTLLRLFKAEPDVEVLLEPVTLWSDFSGENPLALLYSDPKRWSFMFQSLVQMTMFDRHLQNCDKKIKMMERSFHSVKYCFAENLYRAGSLTTLEHHLLGARHDWTIKTTDVKQVDLVVYLRASPERCIERIRARGRTEEKDIPLEYIQQLHGLHEEWIAGLAGVDCLVLDASSSPSELYQQLKKKLELC